MILFQILKNWQKINVDRLWILFQNLTVVIFAQVLKINKKSTLLDFEVFANICQ